MTGPEHYRESERQVILRQMEASAAIARRAAEDATRYARNARVLFWIAVVAVVGAAAGAALILLQAFGVYR